MLEQTAGEFGAMRAQVLRPGRKERVVYFVAVAIFLVMSIAACVYNPLVGAIGLALFGSLAVFAGFRLWHPRAYATELCDDRFRVYGGFGQLVHEVRWIDVDALTFFRGNGLRGPGSELFLAWRCEPRQRRRGLMPAVRGGRNDAGVEFDGALFDDYLGLDAMLELFAEHVARARGADRPATAWERLGLAT